MTSTSYGANCTTARIQLGRLKKRSDVSQAVLNVAEEKVKILERGRDDLYTGPDGIGRRSKRARPAAETVEATDCPICLDPISPNAADARTSLCHPVPHIIHIDCWQRQSQQMRRRCPVCRQKKEVSSALAMDIYKRFPGRGEEGSSFTPYRPAM